MNKKTKLTEKATRIPDVRQAQWEESLSRYLSEVEKLNKESARTHRFAMFLQELFPDERAFLEEFSAGIEQSLKIRQEGYVLRGEADNLFGNIILEFKNNILKKTEEAEDQLRRYAAIQWSQESPAARTPYLCIATDGVRFITYSPTLADPEALNVAPDGVHLELLEKADWTQFKSSEVYYWLDRYFLRKEILHPTSESIVGDFGAQSHAFRTAMHGLLTLWRERKTENAFAVVYESWEKYLLIVYGSDVAGDELFVRHTYLATLAKLMAWMRITEEASLPENADIIEMLEGNLFKKQGIENFIEEDFFSWLAREEAVKVSVSVVRQLFSLLQNYRLRELSEDVLKSLYQQLVDPETRHDLGEYYTPDWLAHRIVRRLLDENERGYMLDPACGSGTFLYLAVREKRERLGNSLGTLHHVLDAVCGADIHPLAVIVAKTNYILALGDLLKKRREGISIPIYLADTIRLPQRFMSGTHYEVRIESRMVLLDAALIDNPELYDRAIELAKDYAQQNKSKRISQASFRNFLTAQHLAATDDNEAFVEALYGLMETLKHFIDIDRDSIWAFVLKNIYKPLFFRNKFDFIIGNPPWIAFRFMEPEYQRFLKRQITTDYELLKGRGELITQMEVATLFLVRTADLYLKNGGIITFVLPRSIFSADQHDALRKRTFKLSADSTQNLFWREIWDCDKVKPLFSVPTCVLVAEKRKMATTAETITGKVLSGKLKRKNASLDDASNALMVEDVEYSLHIRGKRSYLAMGKGADAQAESYYKKKFFQGATIVPRSFWFVQVKPSPLGFNPNSPPLETDVRAIKDAKKPYHEVKFSGNVESEFLYASLLSADLLPFGHFGYRLLVLPLESKEDHYKLIDAKEARGRGFLNLAEWLEEAERVWAKLRGAKAEQMSIYERLNRVRGLTMQNPQAKYRVIYNHSGTFMTAAVIPNEPVNFEIDGQSVSTCGYIVDVKTYFSELDDEREAFFLTAVLNAPVIDELIKPMQSRGLFGPRDIHKKPLELPIPQFDARNPMHQQLAKLGEQCSTTVEAWRAGGGAGASKNIGRLRSAVRVMLNDELQEIDALVKTILK